MRAKLRPAAVPVFQALTSYWGTTVLLVAACAAGLAVMWPVTALARWTGGGAELGLALPALGGGDIDILWGAFAQTTAEVRQAAVATLARLLLGVAVGVLAVTWFTTLSLSMARASGRATEIGVRRAVGASRRQLLAAALLEGATIALLALVVGGATGVAAARASLGAWPGTAAAGAHAPGIAAVAATLGGIVLGALIPLLFARRSRIAVVDPTPLGLLVPALQLGVSLTVLVTASLLERGGARVAPPAGSRLGTGTVYELTTRGVPPAELTARYATLLRGLHAGRAVALASLSSPGTLTGLGPIDVVWSQCGACAWGGLALPIHGFFATHYVVSADTFRALGLRLVAGRGFTDREAPTGPPVAVVSWSLAQQHFDVKGAVGKLLLRVGHLSTTPYQVVGVVEDQQPAGLGGGLEPREAVYLSALQHPPSTVDVLVRGDAPGALDAEVSGALAAAFAPGSTTVRSVSEAGLLSADAAPLRWFAGMFGLEGFGLLAIATIGTFAMMWLWVHSLLVELGIRRAVGARRRSVMAYVLWRAVAVAAGGAAFGSWLGMMVWDALGSAVSGLPAWDPAAVLRYGLLLTAAALAGAVVPAWRAAHTPPTALLAS